jgi:hypothetical protein
MSITSNSRPRWRAALVVGALLGSAALLPLHVQAADQKQQNRNSPEASKPLQAAQKALSEKKFPDALAALKQAEALPKKNAYDQHLIDIMTGQAAAGTQDWAEAGKRFESASKDGFDTPQEQQQQTLFATETYFNAAIGARNTDQAAANAYFGKAIELGKKALEGGAGTDVANIVAKAAYIKDDYPTTRQVVEQSINAQIQKGETPTEDTLELWRSACSKMKDNDCLFKSFKTTLAYYPKPEYWEQMLGGVIFPEASRNPTDTLQLYRLMLETNTLKRSSEYGDMADEAMKAGSPGEAKSVLEKGFANNVFTGNVQADNKKVLASATAKAKADQATLDAQAKEIEAAPTGQKYYSLGFAYFGYGQYDKATEMLSKAIAKGGLRNEADTRLLLGISQLKSGHRDDALKTFSTVKGNTALEQLAQLWPLAAKGA